MVRRLAVVGVMVMLIGGMAASPRAATFDRTTYFSFNQPVALPGVTLPAGTYVFRLPDPIMAPGIVQVMSRSGSQSFAMLHTLPANRGDVPATPEIRFMETPAGVPNAIQAFWTAGDSRGYEFIYSKEQRRRLTHTLASASASAPPPSSPTIPADDGSSVTGRGEPDDAEAPAAAAADERRPDDLRSEEVAAADQRDEPSAQARSSYQDGAAASPNQEQLRKELPATAGVLPLMLILGLVSLCGGLWLKR